MGVGPFGWGQRLDEDSVATRTRRRRKPEERLGQERVRRHLLRRLAEDEPERQASAPGELTGGAVGVIAESASRVLYPSPGRRRYLHVGPPIEHEGDRGPRHARPSRHICTRGPSLLGQPVLPLGRSLGRAATETRPGWAVVSWD